MKSIVLAGVLALMAGAAKAEVKLVELDGMTALMLRTPINLDSRFATDMVTVTVSPAGPQAQGFAQAQACGEAKVMGTTPRRVEGDTWTFEILCGDY